MAHSIVPSHMTLAEVFLARIPQREHAPAIRDLAARIDDGTIDFVAALLERCPDEEASHSLQDYLTRAIERGDAATAATTCLHYPRILQTLLAKCEAELVNSSVRSMALVYLQTLSSGQTTSSSELSHILDLVSQRPGDTSNKDDKQQLQDIVNDTSVYLDFIKRVFRIASASEPVEVELSLVKINTCFLSYPDATIAAAARDTLYSFLASYRSGAVTLTAGGKDLEALHQSLWTSVNTLLDQDLYRSTAYGIWLRWLELPGTSEERQQAILTEAYWNYLVRALADGDTEQRKSCLHILRKSLAVTEVDIHTSNMDMPADKKSAGYRTTAAEYSRFCTVYETIVIGRYLNQATQCVRDLDVFASDRTQVHRSWLFSLLQPALSPTSPDGIKKLLGNWLMSTDMDLSLHATEFAHLFQTSFLPWATQGQYFTSSLRGHKQSVRCEHGSRLASFVARLLRSHSGESQTAIRLQIVRPVFQYLQENKNRMLAYAIVYLLHGVVQGLKSEATPSMGTAELESILDLSTSTGLPEVARDLLLVYCGQLSELVNKNDSTSDEHLLAAKDTRLLELRAKVDALRQDPSSTEPTAQWKDMDSFVDSLRTTRHSCLQGKGLQAACQSLLSILNASDASEAKREDIHFALDAVWDELEIQDYPKDSLLLIPGLIFHTVCVSHTLEDDALAGFVKERLSSLRTLSNGRIYVWPPLMKSLRAALLNVPAAASKLAFGDFIADIADRPPYTKSEFLYEAAAAALLAQEPDIPRDYNSYYGDHSHAGYAAFFDLVNRLGTIDRSLAVTTYEKLITPWADQKPPVPVHSKWKQTTQLQTMLILSEQTLPFLSVPEAHRRMDTLFTILALEPLPRFRFLVEWMIVRIVMAQPDTGNDVLERLSSMDHHTNPKFLASLTKTAVMMAGLASCPEELAEKVASRVVALSSSSKIIIRHEAQWSFPMLWDWAVQRGWSSITDNSACACLNEYIKSLERYMVPLPAREMERLDPDKEFSLAGVSDGQYLRMEPPIDALVTKADFESLWEKDDSNQHLPKDLPHGTLPLDGTLTRPTVSVDTPEQNTTEDKAIQESARAEAFAALQTKGTAYLATDTNPSEASTRNKDLIVVGSLVDNAYNLGGLSRISEIFGASALYISSPHTVLTNKDFTSVAVASQNHLPIHELSVNDLQAFLTQKKIEGYSVVGVEQTDRSVILGAEGTVLPEKTLLVMGAEKEGIPAHVLGETDLLVEIPQRGVTRSMNVQTAAGVVLYEYARQHGGKKG